MTITNGLSTMRTILTMRWKMKFSYAVMIEPQMLMGKVNARLNERSINMMRTFRTSSGVIDCEKRPSALK